MSVKFPEVEVELVGQDGNAFFILGRVAQAMKRAGIAQADIDAYHADATSGDYNHLLAVTMNTVTCDASNDEDDWDEYILEGEDW